MEFVASDASILAFICFTFGLIVMGLFFAGVHVMPDPEKSAATVSSICKVAGMGELIGAFIMLIGSPLGPGASLFMGSLVGFFGLTFIAVAWTLEKGGDSRPLGTVLLFMAVLFAIYAVFAGKVPGMTEFASLCWLGVVAALCSWIGSWNWSATVGKIGGWLWVVIGLWGIEMWATNLFNESIKVMLGA
ncbi:MAG: hypothetical protein J7K94_00915 [Dehalococcoidia bacterium]|nr:hypothetical protein [Dehalococcoidia bacterium]